MTNSNKKKVLINFISIIGCIISIGAISIFTILQTNADVENPITNPLSSFNYSGLENNAGVLKYLNFTKKNGDPNYTVNSFYMENNNIIIKDPNVFVPSLHTSGNIILGGSENTTESANTPIIGGYQNTTFGDNTTFGGEGNENKGGTLIGGSNNKIEGEGVIIGGTNNTIGNNATNTIILGGNDNIINNGDNIIAAGEGINANNNSNNSFIFNNDSSNYSQFTPETGNTFYINSKGGLGLNGESNNKTTVIHGGVSIGEIDFNNGCVDENDIGIMGTANSCLLACTEFSLNSGWALLENSDRCIDWCKENPNICVIPPDIQPIDPIKFHAYCTGTVFPFAEQCFSSFNPEIYEDVVFTYNYVNTCPDTQEKLDNPCTYKCPEGYSFGDGTCKKNCIKTGNNGEEIIIHHGESLTLYQQEHPTCPAQCLSKTRTCNDGNFESTDALYTYLTCQIQENQCDENEYNLEESDKIEGGKYIACTGYTINGNSCTQHIKYKLNGCKEGYTQSGGVCYKDCNFNGIRVQYGKTITGYKYQSSNCKDEHLCSISKILKCGDGGSFSPNAQEYPFTGCKLIGESCSGYNLKTCPNNGICSSCTGYTLSGNSCNQFIRYKLNNCITGYTKTGNECKADCQLPRGGSIPHDRTTVGYKNNSQICPSGCEDSSNKKTMRCNDGVLEGSGTYIYSGCTTKVLSGQGFNRLTKVNHAICESLTGYSIQNNMCVAGSIKYKCTTCQTGYTRNGQDRNGNNVKCLKDCELKALPNNNTVYINGSGGTIITYLTGYITCPNMFSDFLQTRTCNDGYLDGSYRYITYTQTGSTCKKETTGEKRTFSRKLSETANNLQMAGAYCEESTFNGISCSPTTRYYTYKCNDGYIWANDDSKCIKCEGNIPANAHINNSTPTGNDSITYSYSTNTSKSCSFSCDDGFSRNGSQCVSNNKKCKLNGIEYIEGTFKSGYENNKPICYNTCNLTKIQCLSGSWRDYENYHNVTGNIYNTCSTSTGYILNNSTLKEGTCNITATSSKEKIFSGETVPNTISNAYTTSTCTEYRSNGNGCKTPIKYKKFYCKSNRSGNTCPGTCTRRGSTFESGATLKLFDRQGDIQCPDSGNSQIITCRNGTRYSGDTIKDFNDGFIYTSAEYNLKAEECSGYDHNYSDHIPSGSNVERCTVYGVSSDKTCIPATSKFKITECPEGYTKVGDTCKEDCKLRGYGSITTSVHYGESITGYKNRHVRCPDSCSTKKITCGENGQFDDTGYQFNGCYVNGISCSDYPYDDKNLIPEGSNIEICTGYNTPNEKSCDVFYRWRINDCQPGYHLVDNECKKDCNFNGKTFIYNETGRAYVTTDCPGPCPSLTIKCGDDGKMAYENGTTIQNNYLSKLSSTCQLSSNNSCSFNFNLTSCPSHGICGICTGYTYTNVCSENRHFKLTSCESGYTKVGDDCYKDCEDSVFGYIKHNDDVTGYKFEDGQCKSITRTCYNGNLNNSGYNLKECSTCITPRGTTVASGDSATGYKETQCNSTNTECASITRTCRNGTRYPNDFGNYKYQNCVMKDGESNGCSDEYNITNSEKKSCGIYDSGCKRYKYDGNSCVLEEYSKLIGCKTGCTYTENTCYKGCYARGKYYEHGQIVTGYKTSSVDCKSPTTECEYETRKCINGERYDGSNLKNLDGLKETCVKTDYTCPNSPISEKPSDTTNCYYETCTTYKYEGGICKETGKKYQLNGIRTPGYYASGATCEPICNPLSTNPCNGPYTAIGGTWGLGYSTRGHGYLCIKNSGSTALGDDSKQCSCGNFRWDGNKCHEDPQDPCGYSINSCNEGVLLETNTDFGGTVWTCGVEGGEPKYCYKCNAGYEPLDSEKKCVKSGVCDFDNLGCNVGDYQSQVNYPETKVWLCKQSNGTTHECRMEWNCNGSCSPIIGARACVDMYKNHSSYKKNECSSAGAYWTYKPEFSIVGPCYIGGFNGASGGVDQLLYGGSPQCLGSYRESCLKWTDNGASCTTTDRNVNTDNTIENVYEGTTADTKCKAMTKPNCSDSAPNNIYTLTLNGNGGKLNGGDLFQNYDMRAGSQLSILSRKPTRDGYTFQGWNTQCNGKGGGYNSSDTMPLKNLSLCAVRSKTCDKYEISRNNIGQCGIEPWWVHPEYNGAGLPEYFSSYESCVDFGWAAGGKEQYEVAPDQYVPCFSCTCKTDSNDTNPNNSACRLIKNGGYESQCQYNTTFPKSITYSACNTDMWKYGAIIGNSFSGITSQSQCPRGTLCIPCVVCSCS